MIEKSRSGEMTPLDEEEWERPSISNTLCGWQKQPRNGSSIAPRAMSEIDPALRELVRLLCPLPDSRRSLYCFKQAPSYSRLPDHTGQRAASDRIMQRNGNRDRSVLDPLLHNPMAATLPDCDKAVLFKYPANLVARKDPKLTQPGPRLV